jgi:ATP-dependent DNA helicase RecQ
LEPSRFIHGFRRANLAIEVLEIAPSRRADLACELVLDTGRRPGIIYTPARKQADTLAAELAGHFATAAYHAGFEGEYRERVQQEFLT